MLHRSSRPRPLRALAPVLALLALAAPAAAAPDDGSFAVPADAPTVATTPSGTAVLAWVRGGSTCSVVQMAGTARPTRAASLGGDPGAPGVAPGSCDTTPVLARFSATTLGGSGPGDMTRVLWGVAGQDAASVLLKLGARTVAQAPTATTPSPLPGPAAELRFWAVELPSTGRFDEVALADAAGVVRQAYAPERIGARSAPIDGPGEAPGTLVRQGRAGATTWQLRRVTTSVLAATPLAPERRVEQHCLEYVTRAEHAGSTVSGPCDDDVERRRMVASVGSECGIGTHVDVLAAVAVRRVVVVTGDGARRTVPLTAFSAGLRAGTLAVGHRLAVRRVVGLDARGRTLASQDVGLGPTGEDPRGACTSTGLTFSTFSAGDEPLGRAPHVVHVVDHGVQLCTRVDRAPRIPADCSLPPTDPATTFVSVHATDAGRFLLGVVPAEVVAARVTLDDRTTQTIAAAPIPGYTGIYAGALRAIAADLPGPHSVDRVELLDARGRVLNREAGAEVAYGPDVTVLPAAGGVPAVHAASVRARSFQTTCFSLGPVPDATACDGGVLGSITGARSVTVQALCAPRRMLVSALLAHRDDRLVVRTTGGREVAARSARLPARAGAAVAGKYYALVALRPHEGLGSAIVRGRAPRRLALNLPPTAQQCGYSDTPGALLDLAP